MIGLAMTRFNFEIDRLEAENAILRQQLAAARGDTPEARRAFADVTRRSDELLEDESFRSFLRAHPPTEKMTAEGILNALAIANGEKVVEMPMSQAARAMLAAHRKARGEG
jgi:hypothetical protein